MSRVDQVQFNVRSAFARKRAHELARQTGMTATQIVEDALRNYVPPMATTLPSGVERRGRILVVTEPRPAISLAEAEAALMAERERDLEG